MNSISGTPGDDILTDTPLTESLDGGGGNDRITDSMGGSDTILGGDGGDVISVSRTGAQHDAVSIDGGSGNDQIQYDVASIGNYNIYGSNQSADIIGGFGNDTIVVHDEDGYSAVTVTAGAGDDDVQFDGVQGTINLGDGNDQLTLAVTETSTLYQQHVTLGLGVDTLSLLRPVYQGAGYPYNVVTVTDFTPGQGGDVVDFSDFLTGVLGSRWDHSSNPFADGLIRLVQYGSDVYLQLGDASPNIYSVPDAVVKFENTTVAAFVTANFNGFDPSGGPTIGQQITGTAGNDTLTGGVGADTIRGLAGDDHIDGGLGDDTVDGDDGNDVLIGGEGKDHLDGGAGDDNLTDDGTADTLVGGDGNDVLNILTPIGQQDVGAIVTMDGGSGDDHINFLQSAPSGYYTLFNVALSGGDGNDVINASNLRGGTIDGGAGDDFISIGQSSSDAGTVTVTLGPGHDTIKTFETSGMVVVTDFQAGNDGDIVDVYSPDGTNPFANGNLSLVQDGVNTEIFQGPFLMLILQNVVADTLTPYNLGGFSSNLFVPSANDFNGDGHSDILWRNDNGVFATWQFGGDGHQMTPNTYGNDTVAPDWHIAETFDFNGDGLSDILWRNVNSGTFTVWEGASAGGFTQNAYTDSTVGTNWSIAAIGDWNGDGRDDIIWHNGASGAVTIWSSTGSGFTENVFTGWAPTDWQIAGTGDFNGDGKADLLWRNQTTGQFVDWLSTGTDFQHDAYSDTSVGLNWHVQGIADFDGDGKDDLLWRNTAAGQFTIWTSNGTGFTPNTYANDTVGPDWQIAQVGDFNDDGKADILWRNTATGTFTTWQSNGHGFDENVVVQSGVGTDWHVQGHEYVYG